MRKQEFRSHDAGCKFLRAYLLVSALVAIGPGFVGCGRGPDMQSASQDFIDLTERFLAIGSGFPENFHKHIEVIRKGVRRNALELVAPVAIRASLQGAKGKRTLKFWATPVFDTGDGFSMTISIRRSGKRFLIDNRYFDPGRKAEDREWHFVEIPLEIRQGDQLEIEVSAGPQRDFTADWLALSQLHLTS